MPGSDGNRTSDPGIVVGVDIGGTKIKAGYMNCEAGMEVIGEIPTPADPEQAVEEIAGLIESSGLVRSLSGVGIGCPGPLDQERGVILDPPNLRRWHDFPICRRLAEQLEARHDARQGSGHGGSSVEVRLENDGNAGALGEAVFGGGKGYPTVVYLSVGTGLGCGIVIDGAVHRGYRGSAGEVWAFDESFLSGGKGRFNVMDYASGKGLVDRATVVDGIDESGSRGLTTREILDACRTGESWALELLESGRDRLAGVTIFACQLLAPDIVVFGGGMCTDPEWFVNPVVDRFRRTMPIGTLVDIPIVRAELWDSAVMYGAVALFPEFILPEETS